MEELVLTRQIENKSDREKQIIKYLAWGIRRKTKFIKDYKGNEVVEIIIS